MPARALLAGIAAALLLPGCARHETDVQSGVRTGVLHQGVGGDPNDLDPQLVSSNRAAAISMALNEGLTNYDPRDLHPVPGVADRWDVSPDGLAYTFHLRPDARWSNGDPITAEDFVFSAHRILSPALAGEFAYMFFPVRGAEDFYLGRSRDFSTVGVRAPDARTLRYELRNPTPYFLTLVAHWSWFPVQPSTILRFGRIDEPFTAWTRAGNFVGNGPFALAEWRIGDRAVVRKNPFYWDAARVRLAEIDFHFISDPDTEERAFRSGQLHITAYVPASRISGYMGEPGSPLHIVPIFSTESVMVNLSRPPLDRPEVRQALSLAIDRSALASQVLRDGSQPAQSLVPPDPRGYTYRLDPRLRFDPVQARRLLAAAGYPGGRGFPRMELFIGGESRTGLGEALQQMWAKELGLPVVLVTAESRVLIESVHAHRFDLAVTGWIGDYLDPMSFLDVYLAGGGHDDPGYHSAPFEELIGEAGAATDPARRRALFERAESQLMRDLPILPLVHRTNVHLVDSSVHGYESNLMDMHPYTSMWLGK
jgi:oligopeptide transport system substrate-binding protein